MNLQYQGQRRHLSCTSCQRENWRQTAAVCSIHERGPASDQPGSSASLCGHQKTKTNLSPWLAITAHSQLFQCGLADHGRQKPFWLVTAPSRWWNLSAEEASSLSAPLGCTPTHATRTLHRGAAATGAGRLPVGPRGTAASGSPAQAGTASAAAFARASPPPATPPRGKAGWPTGSGCWEPRRPAPG